MELKESFEKKNMAENQCLINPESKKQHNTWQANARSENQRNPRDKSKKHKPGMTGNTQG